MISRKVVNKNGDTYWFNWFNKQDQLHREDGPACECANGDKEWWLNGEKYSEKEHKWRILI